MSIHPSLRTAGSLTKHRNVLTRTERILKLQDAGRWVEGKNKVLGLPKVKNIKAAAKKKAKDAADGADGVAVPAAGTAPAAGAVAATKGAAKAPAAKAPAAKK